MADRNDELLAIANQRATQEALQQIQHDIEDNATSYYEWLAAGRYRDAGIALRNAHALNDEAARIVGAAQQQQQAQQRQQQYTEGELHLMNHYPDQVARNWNTALTASKNLVASKRKADPEADLWAYRNSPEYLGTVAHALGILDANFAESNETTSADEALRASQSKYGSVSVDEYNQGVQRLAELKKYGLYPMGQT